MSELERLVFDHFLCDYKAPRVHHSLGMTVNNIMRRYVGALNHNKILFNFNYKVGLSGKFTYTVPSLKYLHAKFHMNLHDTLH